MERDHAAELTQGAQEALSMLRESYDRKKAEAEPHRQLRREAKDIAQRTADKFRCAAPPRPPGGGAPPGRACARTQASCVRGVRVFILRHRLHSHTYAWLCI